MFIQYFCCQNWDQWHKLSGKNTHIFFFYFWFKNKWVWAEKIRKKQKNSKHLKVAGNYLSIYFTQVFQIFHLENQNNQLLLLQFLQTAEDRNIYLHCVRSLSWCATTLATLMHVHIRQRMKNINKYGHKCKPISYWLLKMISISTLLT